MGKALFRKFGVERGVALLVIALLIIGSSGVSGVMAAPPQQKGATITVMAVGDTIADAIDPVSYEKVFSFNGTAGEVVTIGMAATSGDLDSYLVLYDNYPSQNPLASDDDSMGGYNAQISGYSLPYTGTYYIVATRFGRETGSTQGGFSLSLQPGAVVAPPVAAVAPAASLGTFNCDGTVYDTAATILFEDVRPGFTYRMTVVGLDGFDPVAALFAEDGSGLCNDDEPNANGSVVDVPGVGVVRADSLTSQILFTTSGSIGDIELNIGGFAGSSGRFAAVLEGMAIHPETEIDAATITTVPAGISDEVYVYMVSETNALDPYMELPQWGIVCDDAGGAGCTGVPAFSGGGVAITNGGRYVTGPYDAGVGVVPDGSPLTFVFSSYAGSTRGNYALILVGNAPGVVSGSGQSGVAGSAGPAAGSISAGTAGSNANSSGQLNFGLAPAYGTMALTAGFTPDPYQVSITPGGPVDASQALGGACYGSVANAPDFRLNYTAGGFNLRLFFESASDTTLIINAPDGQWYCDDDSYGSLNPAIDFMNPQSGQYDIWVGSYGGGTASPGTLSVTEVAGGAAAQPPAAQPPAAQPPAAQPPSGSLDFTQSPTYGTAALTAGFTPDPYQVGITPGGPIDTAQAIGGNCWGSVASAPDFRLNYTAGGYGLSMFFESTGDTTLVINAPDGQWYCDDDSYGNLNPLVSFGSPASGQYDIWVGSFGGGAASPGTLSITEVAGGAAAQPPAAQPPAAQPPAAQPPSGSLDFSAAPTFGTAVLSAGFTPDPYQVGVTSGGAVDVGQAIGGNCLGYAASAPDFRLNYTAGSFSLNVYFESGSDTTLVVNAPDGQWYCDDDSRGNLNPAVYFTSPASGQYDIWVGSYDAGSGAGGTLSISEIQ